MDMTTLSFIQITQISGDSVPLWTSSMNKHLQRSADTQIQQNSISRWLSGLWELVFLLLPPITNVEWKKYADKLEQFHPLSEDHYNKKE